MKKNYVSEYNILQNTIFNNYCKNYSQVKHSHHE